MNKLANEHQSNQMHPQIHGYGSAAQTLTALQDNNAQEQAEQQQYAAQPDSLGAAAAPTLAAGQAAPRSQLICMQPAQFDPTRHHHAHPPPPPPQHIHNLHQFQH